MAHPTPITLFFAGTDTDVGKTYTAALATRMFCRAGHRVGVYKPVASGCREVDGDWIADDAVALWEAAGRPLSLETVCPQRLIAPLAPPEAAALQAQSVDADLLRSGAAPWMQGFDLLIVEGAGGLFSPLADRVLNVNLVQQLAADLIIVAANRLGVIHQTLATVDAARHHGLTPRGILLCEVEANGDASISSNARQIASYTSVPILGAVPFKGNETHLAGLAQLVGPS